MDAMQESGQPTALQLLFIELRVGLARSAIQAALLLNGGAAVALLLFLAHIVGSPVDGPLANVLLIKWAFAVFGLGLFVASMTFVNAYVAQGAIASGQSNAFGNTMRRLGLSLIVVSLLLFLAGIALVVVAI
jgi:hypothetical protein